MEEAAECAAEENAAVPAEDESAMGIKGEPEVFSETAEAANHSG